MEINVRKTIFMRKKNKKDIMTGEKVPSLCVANMELI